MASPAVSVTNTANQLNTELLKELLGENLIGEANPETVDTKSGDEYSFDVKGSGSSITVSAERSLTRGTEKRLEWVKSQLNGREQVIANTGKKGAVCNIEKTDDGYIVTHISRKSEGKDIKAIKTHLNKDGEIVKASEKLTPESSMDALLPDEVKLNYTISIEKRDPETGDRRDPELSISVTQDSKARSPFRQLEVTDETKKFLIEKFIEAAKREVLK